MVRFLYWIALGLLVWWLLRPRGRRTGASPPPASAAPRVPEAMVDCARCGVHLPASEALRDAAGLAYCCAEHRAAGPRNDGTTAR